MRQQDWDELFDRDTEWLRLFGTDVPVRVAAADPKTRRLCDIVDELAQGKSSFTLIQGDRGSGKSTLAAAAEAAFIRAGLDHVVLDARRPETHHDVFKALNRDGARPIVLMDDSETATSSVRSLLDKRALLSGLFITASSIGSDIAQKFSGEDCYYVSLPHLQLRASTLLLIASLTWQELLGSDARLSSACDESAVMALMQGPFVTGAWMLREVLSAVVEQLIAERDIAEGSLRRRLTNVDIASALTARMATSFSPASPQPDAIAVIVEGDTDVVYLRRAGQLALQQRNWDLLDGLSLQAAGAGRAGGGEAVTARLLAITDGGASAVGIYDNDAPGRRAAKLAQDRGRRKILLPEVLDPLGRRGDEIVVEIEDLIPVELLTRFYLETQDAIPQERHWHNCYWRIVPRGVDKEALADWVASCADFTQMEAVVYLLCRIRREAGLPLPTEAPALAAWEETLSARRTKDTTAGLPGR